MHLSLNEMIAVRKEYKQSGLREVRYQPAQPPHTIMFLIFDFDIENNFAFPIITKIHYYSINIRTHPCIIIIFSSGVHHEATI